MPFPILLPGHGYPAEGGEGRSPKRQTVMIAAGDTESSEEPALEGVCPGGFLFRRFAMTSYHQYNWKFSDEIASYSSGF